MRDYLPAHAGRARRSYYTNRRYHLGDSVGGQRISRSLGQVKHALRRYLHLDAGGRSARGHAHDNQLAGGHNTGRRNDGEPVLLLVE